MEDRLSIVEQFVREVYSDINRVRASRENTFTTSQSGFRILYSPPLVSPHFAFENGPFTGKEFAQSLSSGLVIPFICGSA